MTPHHPFGPSIIEKYDPRSRGCRAYIPSTEESFKAEAGSLKHRAFATRDLSILEGDTMAEAEVKDAIDFFDGYNLQYNGETEHEVLLANDINFGTVDLLKFNRTREMSLVGDLKFGEWNVTPASKNLQLLNYIVLTFDDFPKVIRIQGIIWHAKSRTSTRIDFRRSSLPHLKERIAYIVTEALRASRTPERRDFTPHPNVCGFCTRIACPARVELASTLVAAWHKKPVKFFPSLDPAVLENQQLADLKLLGASVRAFADAVDAEAKRRAVEDHSIIPGFELTSRSTKRLIVGAEAINQAQKVILDAWTAAYPETPLSIGEVMVKLAEIGVGDLEKMISQQAPRGEIARAQKLIASALNSAKLITASETIVLAQIKA